MTKHAACSREYMFPASNQWSVTLRSMLPTQRQDTTQVKGDPAGRKAKVPKKGPGYGYVKGEATEMVVVRLAKGPCHCHVTHLRNHPDADWHKFQCNGCCQFNQSICCESKGLPSPSIQITCLSGHLHYSIPYEIAELTCLSSPSPEGH